MRINDTEKRMEMEARDINYILPAYVRSYQFHMKNELPTKIIFPMFVSVRAAGVDIPIEWVPPLEPVAVEIAKDGSNVAEVTEEQEAVLDEKDKEIADLKAQVAELETTGRGGKEGGGTETTEAIPARPEVEGTPEQQVAEAEEIELGKPEPESPARTAFKVDPDPTHQPPPSRIPKAAPGGDIGPGAGPSDMHPRDRRDQARTARDLVEEPEIEGAAEKPFEKEIKRSDDGRPIVEEKPDAPSGQ